MTCTHHRLYCSLRHIHDLYYKVNWMPLKRTVITWWRRQNAVKLRNGSETYQTCLFDRAYVTWITPTCSTCTATNLLCWQNHPGIATTTVVVIIKTIPFAHVYNWNYCEVDVGKNHQHQEQELNKILLTNTHFAIVSHFITNRTNTLEASSRIHAITIHLTKIGVIITFVDVWEEDVEIVQWKNVQLRILFNVNSGRDASGMILLSGSYSGFVLVSPNIPIQESPEGFKENPSRHSHIEPPRVLVQVPFKQKFSISRHSFLS